MDPRELKDAAAEHFRKGRFSKAAEAYLSLSKADPKDPQYLIKLGDSYRRDGQKPKAVDAYRNAVDAYAKQGVMIKAIAACKLILEIDANQKEAQEALAQLIAKRYVKRTDIPGMAKVSRPAASAQVEALDLPEASGTLELEGRGPVEQAEPEQSEPSAAPQAPPPKPKAAEPDAPRQLPKLARPTGPASKPPVERPPVPPVLSRKPEAEIELEGESIEIEEGPPAPIAAAPKEEEPSEIELDIDMSGTVPPTSTPAVPLPAGKADVSVPLELGDTEDLALDVAGAAVQDDLIVEEPEALGDESLDISLGVNTEEQEVIRVAATAATRPSTTVGKILTQAARHDDEVEIFALTASQEPDGAIVEQHAVVAPSLDDYLGIETAQSKAAASADGQEGPTPVTAPVSMKPAATIPEGREVTDGPAASSLLPSEVDQSHVPLFSELPHEAFVELLERLKLRRVEAGEVILKEGDEGKSIYILATGVAQVVKAAASGPAIELAVLQDGAFFGEMALLNGSPRVASVIAMDDCDVLEITEEILRELTAKHPSVGQSLKKFYRQRLLQNVMAISPLFRAFDKPDRRSLVELFRVREAKKNEAILSEGQPADGLYVVMHGAALVQKKDPKTGRAVPLAALKEGDVFGEMSLLTKKPVSASVIAKRNTLVLRLPKPVFDELMFTHPAVLEVVSELSDQRTKVNEMILSGVVDAPREALAFL
jgi:CRP-like cAMP-binding protein